LQARSERRDVGVDLSSDLASYRSDEPTDDVPLLRDDRAPVDSLLDGTVGQRYVRVRANETNATVGANATVGVDPAALRAPGATATA
jgi:hypothetical protein